MTDIYYVAKRLKGKDTAFEAVDLCLQTFEVATVDRAVLERARQFVGEDYEDNLQLSCAERLGLEAIVTRDMTGFATAAIPVWTPKECVERLRLD